MLLMATAIPFNVYAYDFSAVAPSGQTLYYEIAGNNATVTYPGNGNNYYYPTEYSKPTGNLTIPSSVMHNGTVYPVVSIGAYAFQHCDSLTSVTIPNSVTSIGIFAFEYCFGLTRTNYTGTVEQWCNIWFQYTYSNPMTYSKNLFINDTAITNLVIPNSVTNIGNYAFCYCDSLTSVTIPNSVTNIGDYAFISCHGLTSVTIPNSVTNIGNHAFTYCGGLTSVTIPNSVTIIGNGAFMGCSGLTSVTIPNSVTIIGNETFSGCSELTSVTIPNSVTIIGNGAFNNCTGLTQTNYTGTVAQWCKISFTNAASNPICYSHNFFINNVAITDLVIPNSVTAIYPYVFYGCSSLTSVSMGFSVGYIGDRAFQNTNLNNVQLLRCATVQLGAAVFPSGCIITIPCGCLSYYQNNSRWSNYSLRWDGYVYTINTVGYGSVEMDETEYCSSSRITITAVSGNHHHFSHWNDGNTENPRTVTLTQDTSFTAIFEPNSYFISTSCNDSSMGTVIGGGLYVYNTTQTLEAEPAEGHHFIRWTDGNTDNPRNILIEGDASYTAVFAIDTLTVNVSSNNMVYGTVNGGGTFVYGSPCTIEAEAYSGYVFVRWSNGVTYNPYTFAVLTNMDIEAVFAPEGSIHNVTVQVQPAGTGTVTGDGPYANGETVTLEAIPNDGYHFVRWQDDVTDNPRTIFVTTDMAFTAFFEADDMQGIVDANGNGIQVWAADGSIIIEGNTDETVHVYDMMGREVTSSVSKNGTFRIHVRTGVYLVKVGNHPIWKVVVLK